MVEIKLENGWLLIHKKTNWIIAKKRPVIIKGKDTYKLEKSSSFPNLETALKRYVEHIRLQDTEISSWKELKQAYEEGNKLLKQILEELNG